MSVLSADLNGMIMAPLRTGPWNLTDLDSVPKNGKKVFSIFHCGGGSTMGYKLAGYDVIGGVEIDPEMMAIYRANHKPKYSFLMDIRDFNKSNPQDKPELKNLDILDGSPPCSSFSMVGAREKAWGDKKKFREGQATQVLDDLFFHFIETAKLLQPKIVVAENVKGLLIGKARGYVKQIAQGFDAAGYDLQLFLLNSAFMGTPQKRERSVFVAKKKSIKWPKLTLSFNEKPILFKDIKQSRKPCDLSARELSLWKNRRPDDLHIGFINQRMTGKITGFTTMLQRDDKPLYTITASDNNILMSEPRHLTRDEVIAGQTFPVDFNFLNIDAKYVCGMSVPPFMMQRVADQVYKQWLSKDS